VIAVAAAHPYARVEWIAAGVIAFVAFTGGGHRHRRRRRRRRRVPVSAYQGLWWGRRYSNYNRYLQSRRWQHQRRRTFRRDHYRCRACGYHGRRGRGLQAHHTTRAAYSRLGHERRSDLMTLCVRDHAVITGMHRSHAYQEHADAVADATRDYLATRR
jgi:hypothetical protein